MHVRSAFGIGVCLIITIVGLITYRYYAPATTPTTQAQRSSEEIRQAWESGVTDIVQVYSREKNAVQARDRLLTLTVPSDKREQHLALVLALEAMIQRRTDADERWERAIEGLPGL